MNSGLKKSETQNLFSKKDMDEKPAQPAGNPFIKNVSNNPFLSAAAKPANPPQSSSQEKTMPSSTLPPSAQASMPNSSIIPPPSDSVQSTSGGLFGGPKTETKSPFTQGGLFG